MSNLSFTWLPTWPNESHAQRDLSVDKAELGGDGPGIIGKQDVMRVFEIVGGPQGGRWQWAIERVVPRPEFRSELVGAQGHADSEDEAKAAAERAYISAG